MLSPFPGMDPYIERRAIWGDFHDRLIVCIQAALQPLLRPKYVAVGKDRLFLVDSDRPVFPDVSVVETGSAQGSAVSLATIEADAPAIFTIRSEPFRQPYLEIVEPAAGNRVVTAIEVLSPENKSGGDGRRSYLQKRRELWKGGANLIEIDVLRAGRATINVTAAQLRRLRPWHHVVVVSRRHPRRREVYAVPLRNRLPRVGVPLGEGDRDVTLDLQAAFTRCYDEGPYPELLHYHGRPPGRLGPEDVSWCENVLRTAGLRPPECATNLPENRS
jgi:hypothetical protein